MNFFDCFVILSLLSVLIVLGGVFYSVIKLGSRVNSYKSFIWVVLAILYLLIPIINVIMAVIAAHSYIQETKTILKNGQKL